VINAGTSLNTTSQTRIHGLKENGYAYVDCPKCKDYILGAFPYNHRIFVRLADIFRSHLQGSKDDQGKKHLTETGGQMKILFVLGFPNPFPGAAWTMMGVFAEDWFSKGHARACAGAF